MVSHADTNDDEGNSNSSNNNNERPQDFPSTRSSEGDSNTNTNTNPPATTHTISPTTETRRTESREKETMRGVGEGSCRSLDVIDHRFDQTPPPPVTTRPTPRPAAWSVSTPASTTTSNNTASTSTGNTSAPSLRVKSLAEIMNDEEKQRDEKQAATIELENLRMVELVQEEEMFQLAMERSITDISGSTHTTSSLARSFQEDMERTESFTTRPIGPRSHSSRKIQEVNRTESPTTRPIGSRSLSSYGLQDTSSRHDNSQSWSSLHCRPRPDMISTNSKRSLLRQRPGLDSLPSVASGRQAVMEFARRNLSSLEVGLIEGVLEGGETTRITTPAGSPRDTDEEDMFDLDPDSPTFEETPRIELAVGGPVLPFIPGPAPGPSAQGSQSQVISQNRSRIPSVASVSPTQSISSRMSCSSRMSYGMEDSPVRLSSSPRPPTTLRHLALRPPFTSGTSAGMGTTESSGTAAENNSSYFLEQAAQHLSTPELEGVKRALKGTTKEEPSAAAATASMQSPAEPLIFFSEAAIPSSTTVLGSVADEYDFSGAEDHLSEEELRQIQQALQASNIDCDHADWSQGKNVDESDLKPASMPLNDKVISDDDTLAIERALREADEEEELKSIQLAMQMQDEEETLQRRGVAARRGQGNVRTITRAELDAEKSGQVGAFPTSTPPRLRHPLEESEEIPPAAGFRMNTTTLQEWARRDQNSVVGPNNEIRTKHDAELHGEANAQRLGLEADERGSLRVGNQAYNSFIQSVRRSHKEPHVQGSRTRSDSDSDTKAEATKRK
jgi:hypothetical protein